MTAALLGETRASRGSGEKGGVKGASGGTQLRLNIQQCQEEQKTESFYAESF